MNKALFSSKKMDWCTPQSFFEELDETYNFKLDAAANHNNAKCKKYYTEEEDGLIQSWEIGGSVWCNPPYGREIGKWVRKAYEESIKHKTRIVLLIPARTDTKYFHDYIYGKAKIIFIKGRLKFTDENGEEKHPAPFPSMLAIYNEEREMEVKMKGKVHDIKILPQYFEDIKRKTKNFEIRKNDRDYKVGDTLILREWDNEQYTGRYLERKVTYILDDKSGYVLNGYVVMSII